MKCNINFNFADRHYERSNGAETGNATVQLARTLASVILKHFIIYKNSPFHFALFFNAIFRCVFSLHVVMLVFIKLVVITTSVIKENFIKLVFIS